MSEEVKPFTMTLSWNNGAESFIFPVLPEKISFPRKGAGKDYDMIKTGRIGTIEKPELIEISFESFFPAHRYPFVHPKHFQKDGKPDPYVYVNYILRWWDTGYPVRFIYIGSDTKRESSKLTLPMSIVSFERWEEGGSPGDIFYSLKLKEYVFYRAKRITAVQKADGTTVLRQEPPPRPDERVPNKTYTLKPGDTLIKVARMELGDSGRYREIQLLNGITDSETRRLQIGRVLQLPPK